MVIALPDQAQGAAESGIAALLSVSNFFFWRQLGYFAPAAEFLPLLHTWSLAVEEQFYLILPLMLLAIWKLDGSIYCGFGRQGGRSGREWRNAATGRVLAACMG